MTMIRSVVVTTVAMLAATAVMAAQEPKAGQLDGRVRFVDFDQHQVVQVVGWLRHSIQIEFSPDEEILQVALGNAVAWEAAPVGHILFLKPREHQPATNMSVVTQRKDGTKRSYQIELATISGPQQAKLPPFFLVKYQYSVDEAARRKAQGQAKTDADKAGEADRVISAAELNGPRNWAYTVQGDTAFEPSAVYDNGKLTTFTFPQNIKIPAIYIVNGDGTESLIPKNVTLTEVIVHAVSAKFILRNGDEVLCVFNEAYVAGGVATGTMTTAPSVERVTKHTLSKGLRSGAGPAPMLLSPLPTVSGFPLGVERLAPNK